MDTPPTLNYPDRMNVFMTTEHFTLQSARSIINSEIMNRVSLYFTTLSSVLIASAFLAQITKLDDLFSLFIWIAFPVLILLGIFTLARLMVLGRLDSVYIRAINRIRHFYAQSAPEMQKFMLFPPHDDFRSVSVYGGYANDMRSNLLSAANAVTVTNSIVATVLVSVVSSSAFGMTPLRFLPFGLIILVMMYLLHGLIGRALAQVGLAPEYQEAIFPAPVSAPPHDKAQTGK